MNQKIRGLKTKAVNEREIRGLYIYNPVEHDGVHLTVGTVPVRKRSASKTPRRELSEDGIVRYWTPSWLSLIHI